MTPYTFPHTEGSSINCCVAETEAFTNAPYACIVRNIDHPRLFALTSKNTMQMYGGVN